MSEPKPLDGYTTAQQLGALRRELIEEGFSKEEASQIAHSAFRAEAHFVVRTTDIRGEQVEQPHSEADVLEGTWQGVPVRVTWPDGLPGGLPKDFLKTVQLGSISLRMSA
jgi:hypothetical protein